MVFLQYFLFYRVSIEWIVNKWRGVKETVDWSRVKRFGDLTTGMEVQVTYKRCHHKAKILSLYLFVVEITYKLHLSLSPKENETFINEFLIFTETLRQRPVIRQPMTPNRQKPVSILSLYTSQFGLQ